MISVNEAESIIKNSHLQLPEEEIPLAEATGRVLNENIYADRDFPPFDRVMMDGIAIDSAAWDAGKRTFSIAGMQIAGSPQLTLEDNNSCLEVMTGSMLPENTDTVIRFEDITSKDGKATINLENIVPGQNVHDRGTDRKAEALLIKKGSLLSAPDVAVIATVGKPVVKVKALPKIAVVSTGDELVSVDEEPKPFQIRKSNSYALTSALTQLGINATPYHFNDEKDILENNLRWVIDNHDVIILSGGVSRGKRDFVPEVLYQLGVQKLFHKVAQRPGKPFWFGKIDSSKVIFALPGNPVSTFMCYCKYIKPWILSVWGITLPQTFGVLSTSFSFQPDLHYFLQVKIKPNPSGVLEAIPLQGKGSGDLANLLDTDAFLELPNDKSTFQKGEAYPLIPFRETFIKPIME